MSLDFALKDMYRKRKQNFPYVITIALTIALTIFLIHFSKALNLNYFIRRDGIYSNPYFFSGSINIVYTQFNTLLIVLIFILAILIVTIICSSFIISKKRDLSIMKALGTLPEKLYSFYLLEAFIIYILGFFLGWIIGLISFGVFNIIFSLLLFTISFEFEVVFSLLLFFSCAIASIMLPGFQLRSMGRKPVINSFSEDIPAGYNLSSPLKLVPKWISCLGLNVKYAILNLTRKKGKFKRFFIIFFLISLILFTLGLGAIVLNSSSSNWINKAQGNNIIVIGHNDVLNNYSSMYRMFSEPSV
ncbi:MAG: FtsX-like permease family protein, partial [Promethearchaeota archaeon]